MSVVWDRVAYVVLMMMLTMVMKLKRLSEDVREEKKTKCLPAAMTFGWGGWYCIHSESTLKQR